MSKRTVWVMGNWKLNPATLPQATDLATALSQQYLPSANVQVAVFPSIIHFAAVQVALGASAVKTGVQNVSYLNATTGAYTGELSASVAAGAGAQLALVGHSERRHVITETASQRLAQISQSLECGLTVVLCVGELLDEREAGKAQSVVKQQLDELFTSNIDNLANHIKAGSLVVAYEPVWAIGTGKTASTDDAQTMHAFIRATLHSYSAQFATLSILYGGSVNTTNARDFAHCEDVDGVLVGGASLNADSFCAIISAFAD